MNLAFNIPEDHSSKNGQKAELGSRPFKLVLDVNISGKENKKQNKNKLVTKSKRHTERETAHKPKIYKADCLTV